MTDPNVKTILIADDEEDLRTIVHMTLEDPKYRIIEATDGEAALALARKEHPDLLILDWMMPNLSGIDVVKALRQDVSTATMPVIMLMAKDRNRDQEEGLAAGVFVYLIKPFSPLELLEKIKEVIG